MSKRKKEREKGGKGERGTRKKGEREIQFALSPSRPLALSPSLPLSLSKIFLLLVVIAPWVLPVYGQGQIAGKVTETGTGEELIGVNLLLVGTARGAATGIDGSYAIANLKAGEYTIKVSYIGFETKLFTGIRVSNGQTTRLDIELDAAVLSTSGEIVVIGEKPLVDVEQSTSAYSVSREEIEAAPLRNVQDVVATQAGAAVRCS